MNNNYSIPKLIWWFQFNLYSNKTICNLKFFYCFLILCTLTGCSAFRPLDNDSPVREDFKILQEDSRILYKPSAIQNARTLIQYIDSSISAVEQVHGEKFSKQVIIHVCDTEECFQQYTHNHSTIAAAVSENGLFLSPRAFRENQQQYFLTHELSHLHLFQQISLLRTWYIPQWFHEGLATMAADGGGGHKVSKKDAIEYIQSGKHFIPIHSSGLFGEGGAFSNRWPLNYTAPNDDKFLQNMNYRQASLFLEYLSKDNQIQNVLRDIEKGESFERAFFKAFDKKPNEVWDKFIQQLNSNKNIKNHLKNDAG